MIPCCSTKLFRKGTHLKGKRFGLFQIAQMTGLFDNLDLAILGGSQQGCLPFPVRLVVFSIHNEDRACEGPEEGIVIMRCQFTIGLGRDLPGKSCFELGFYYPLWELASKGLFLHPGESMFRKERRDQGTVQARKEANDTTIVDTASRQHQPSDLLGMFMGTCHRHISPKRESHYESTILGMVPETLDDCLDTSFQSKWLLTQGTMTRQIDGNYPKLI